ncbi:MAG: SDR family NAD(P)-dependent oxidoreductase [Bacteroidia bacterium]|nr:SDR family NAD(P)-dependent oxidoreductase [Bacteroidia bacterium]
MAERYKNKRAVIIGATSGIGREVAKLLHADGWFIGVAGRRLELLETLKEELGSNIIYKQIDICDEDADRAFVELLEEVGEVDLVFHASGVGRQNPTLEKDIEMRTMDTNVLGFTRIITAAYRYFAERGGGHIAVISSIAGTKGLGAAPAYSATKRFQNTYIQCLCQHSAINKTEITFTDIRPGFVDTAILNKEKHYPMLMDVEYVAKKIVKAVYARKRSYIVDWRYSVLVWFWRMIPDWVWEKISIKN